MFMELDSVAVPREDWIAVLRDDEAALERLRTLFDGEVLYEHALSVGFDTHIKVTIRDLECYGVIKSIKLQKEII